MRRATPALAVMLAGCVPFMPDPMEAAAVQGALREGRSVVLARFVSEPGGASVAVHGRQGSRAAAGFWRIGSGEPTALGTLAPSAEAAEAGWVAQPLAPGRYLLRINAPRGLEGESRDYVVTVADGAAATYIGTFPMRCVESYGGICWNTAPPRQEAGDAVPALAGQPGPIRAALAEPLRVELARRGWPAPARIDLAAEPTAWRAAVNWSEFVNHEGSSRALQTAGALMDAGSRIGTTQVGAVIAAPFMAGAIGSVMVAGAAATREAIEQSQTARRFAPCLERLAALVGPAGAPARIGPAAEPNAVVLPRGGAPASVVWQASLTRVVLRRCGDPLHFGVETATRWSTNGREAHFVRPVARVADDPAMLFSRPAAWEEVAGEEAPCRPFEQYCASEGDALVIEDVTRAVTAARDAILATR